MIAVVVPVLRRPQNVRPLMASLAQATSVPYRLLFVATEGDTEEIAEIEAAGAEFVTVPAGRDGDYARKINAGYRATSEPYILTAADDLAFHPGWDTEALACFTGPIGVVGTNDLANHRVIRGDHSTHSLISRDYADTSGTIDAPGAILAECYPHEFCDDELVATAKARGAFVSCPTSIVEHLHPTVGKAPSDALYKASPDRMRRGRQVFQRRKAKWEALARVPVSVIVATFGDESWKARAEQAKASVEAQVNLPAEVLAVHGSSLAEARNAGAEQATSEWLCFLDADDELHPRYMTAMSRYLHPLERRPLTPAVQFVVDGRARAPRLFNPKDLKDGNYLVIATLVRREVFFEAGGFDPQWEAWEDWAFWRRVIHLTGPAVRVRAAVYRAFWRADGRNNTIADKDGLTARIHADYDAWVAARC